MVVVRRLQEQALFPIKIQEGAVSGTGRAPGKSIALKDYFGGVRSRDVVLFSGQLATLANAGLPLERCLTILVELSENPKMRDIVADILRAVQGGSSFADALARHPKQFSKLFVNMVRAGETGGVLELVLKRLAEFMEEV